MATMVHTPSSSSSTSHHHSAHCGCTSSNGGHHSAGHGQTYSYSASDFDLLKALTSTSGASRQASSSNSNSNSNSFAAKRALLAQQQQQKASLRRPQLDPLILETAAHSGPHVTRNHFLHEFYPHPEDPSSAFSWHADYRRPGYGTSRRPAYADCDIGPDEEPKQQQQTSNAAASSSSSSSSSMKKQQPAVAASFSSSAGPSALNDPKSATQQPRAVESDESSINVSKTTPAQSAAVDGEREEIDENLQGPSIYRSRQAPRKVRLERERKEQGQAVIHTDVATVADGGLVRAEQEDTSIHTNLKDIDPAQKLEHDLLPSTAPATAASLQDSIFHPDPVELPKILKVSEPSFFHTFTQAAAQSTASALGIAATNTSAAAPTRPPLQVVCFARTRVPTPHGEVFLHLYKNNWDDKEHLAFVFDRDQLDDTSSNPNANAPGETAPSSASLPESSEAYGTLRSKSLDAVWREGETDIERIVRGAYVGRLSSTTAKVSRARDAPTSSPGGSHAHMHVAPKLSPDEPVLIRIHSECFTGETIGSQRCDCGEQLDEAFRLIHTSPSGLGIIIYLRQEGRGIGLLEKIKAYNLQDLGHDTVTANLLLGHSADLRNYALAGEMLRDLGVDKNVRLLTNNPDKIDSIEKEGIKVAERVPMVPRGWSVQIPKILLQRKKKSKSKKASSGERPKILKKRRPALQTKASTASIQSTVQTPPLLSPSTPIFDGAHPRKARNKTIEALRSSTAGGGPYDSDGIRSVEASASEAETEDYDDDAADSYGVRSITGSLEDDEQRAAGQSHEEGEDEEQDEEEDDDDSDTDDSAEREEALEDYLISMNRTGVGMIGAGLTQSKELEKYLKTKIERMGHMLVAPATPPSTPLPLRRNARSKKEKAQGGHGHLHAHGHSRLSHSHHTLPPSHIASNMQDSIASLKTDEEGIACDAGPDCEDCRRQKLQEGYFDQDDAYGEDMFG